MTLYDQTLQRVADAIQDGEPMTARQIAQHKIAMAVRDAFLATGELYKLRLDPDTADLFYAEEGELWAIKTRVDLLLSEIRSVAR